MLVSHRATGASFVDLVSISKFVAGINIDLWIQKFYGSGFGINTNLDFSISNKFYLMAQVGYKTRGYVIGRTVDKGLAGFVGIRLLPCTIAI